MSAVIADFDSHQRLVVERVTARCRDLHGIVVLHTMASGKTFTALSVIENMDDRYPVFIVCPKGIQAVWKREALKFGVDTSRYNFVTYETLGDHRLVFDQAIVVFDEAHNIVNTLRDPCKNVEFRRELLGSLLTAKKVVLLTGTPIVKQLSDLAILVNIAAGYEVMPADPELFRDKYATVRVENVIGGIIRFFKMLGGYLSKGLSYLDWVSSMPTVLRAIHAMDIFSVSESIRNGLTSVLNTFGYRDYADLVLWSVETDVAYRAGSAAARGAGTAFTTAFSAWSYVHTLKRMANDITKALPNSKKIADDARAYVSYHADLPRLPNRQYVLEPITLSDFQMMQYVKNSITVGPVDTELMELVDRVDPKDYSGTSFRMIDDPQTFLETSRVISNLSPSCADAARSIIEQKGRYGRRYLVKGRRGVRSDGGELSREVHFVCRKYMRMASLIRNYRTTGYLPVVYTNFDRYGLQTFGVFLDDLDMTYITIHPDDPPEETRQLLDLANSRMSSVDCVLLHPAMKEGVEFPMAPAILVMEPVVGLGNQQQVYARILRPIRSPELYDRFNKDSEGNVIKYIHQFCGSIGQVDGRHQVASICQHFIEDFAGTLEELNFDAASASGLATEIRDYMESVEKDKLPDFMLVSKLLAETMRLFGDAATIHWRSPYKRAIAYFQEYKKIKSISDDPFSFMARRVINFSIFGGYSDGDILDQNEKSMPEFIELFREFNIDETRVACDGSIMSESYAPVGLECHVDAPGVPSNTTSCKRVHPRPTSVDEFLAEMPFDYSSILAADEDDENIWRGFPSAFAEPVVVPSTEEERRVFTDD